MLIKGGHRAFFGSDCPSHGAKMARMEPTFDVVWPKSPLGTQARRPAPQLDTLIGKRISRVDGAVKVSGHAKYSYDYNPKGLLFGKVLRCPHAHARVTSFSVTQTIGS